MNLRPQSSARSTIRRRRLASAVATLVVVLASGIALSMAAMDRPEPRSITLVARDMAFYLEHDPTPNPRLALRRGESLRITLRNEDRGMTHDLVLEGEGRRRATRALRPGESATLELRAPDRSGEVAYSCSLHDQMMRSVLEVR